MEEGNDKILYIIRGLPGSGKSTLAKLLNANSKGVILSTDDFFINSLDGSYHYVQQGINKAHIWNQERAKIAMKKGISPIIIDNTNLQPWEAYHYILAANNHSYRTLIKEPETDWKFDPERLLTHGKHGLTLEALKKFESKYEAYSVSDVLGSEVPGDDPKERAKIREKLENSDLFSEYSDTKISKMEVTVTKQQLNIANIRIEFTKNDGQKMVFKPVVVKSGSEYEALKMKACQTLNLRYTKTARVFDLKGKEIIELSDFENNGKYCISPTGTDFIPIALKLTAEERKKLKQQQQQQNVQTKKEKRQNYIFTKTFDKLPLGISEIIKHFLYLGSGRDAHTPTELAKFSIKHIINVSEFPKPPKISDLKISYTQFILNDEVNENLFRYFGEIAELLEKIRNMKERVLVHCAIGKSRSPAVVLAYLMKYHNKTLKAAYIDILNARPLVFPNVGFLRQLRAFDVELFGKNSVSWDYLKTDTTLLSWLRHNAEETNTPNYLWWEVISKKKYSVRREQKEEFFSECAKALVREEPLKLVELCGTKRKLFLDIDFKSCMNGEDADLFNNYFSISILPTISNLAKTVFEEIGSDFSFLVTSSSSYFTSISEPTINWKYGYHIIWPHLIVDFASHSKFVNQLIAIFTQNEKNPTTKSDENYLSGIRKLNSWEEVFDINIFKENSLRLLYSAKTLSCKYCRKRDAQKKTSRATRKKVEDKKKEKVCIHCRDSGFLDTRIHSVFGLFDSEGKMVEKEKGLGKEEEEVKIGRIRKELEMASILVWEQGDYTELTPKKPREEFTRQFMERVEKPPNSELNIVLSLRTSTPEEISKKFGLKVTRHQEHLNLHQFSYSQTGSPMEIPLVQECRGIILDAKMKWKVVAFPYKKFFNYGESNAHPIDWNTAKIYEKIDGSLACLYWYAGQWHLSSSSVPDGSGIIHHNQKFSEFFWEIWKKRGYTLPLRTDYTYMFEIVSPRNIIIVQHSLETLILHGARSVISYEEIDPEIVGEAHGWEYVQSLNFDSIEDVVSHSKDLNPFKKEGYVVCDGNWNRVKIKGSQYVALAYLHTGTKEVNVKSVLEIVRSNEGDEFLVHFPQVSDVYFAVKDDYEALVEELLASLEIESSVTGPRADLLTQIQQSDVNEIFGLREFLKQIPIDLLYQTLFPNGKI